MATKRHRVGKGKVSKASLTKRLYHYLQAKNPKEPKRIVMSWIRGFSDLPMVAFGNDLITKDEYRALGGDPGDVFKGTR
jgi:hypothetical protein